MPRPRATPLAPRLRQRLRAYRWGRVAVLAASSLALALGLVAYLFGWADHFVTRLLTAFFVDFCLLAVTFLGILPFIGWATTHWFGAGWAAGVDAAPVRRTPSLAKRPLASRTTTTQSLS